MPRLRPFVGLSLVVLLLADCDPKSGTTEVNGVIASIRIDPANATLVPNQTANGLFKATALDAANGELSNKGFTWSSSNTAVATVAGGVGAQGNPINVTSLAAGTATITATSEGKSGSATLTVEVSAHPRFLTGRVFDATSPTQVGIPNATVSFVKVGGAPFANSATTTADGSFSSPDLSVSGDLTTVLDITAVATGYVSVTQYTVQIPAADHTVTIEPFPLVPASTQNGGIIGTVRNARDNTGIADAEVRLYQGTGGFGAVAAGRFVKTVTSDAGGAFSITALAAGTYTVDAKATGFSEGTRTAIAVGNNGITAGQDVSLSPSGAAEIRIVLTWGADPSDLDAHLTGPNTDATRFHVFYPTGNRGNLTAPPFALLDVDDQESFGPETITITQLNTGVYRYSVHDFSNRESASSSALGGSGAKVEIYVATGIIKTYFVPSQPGTLWTVFELTGGTLANPTIVDRNEMGVAENPEGILDARPRVGGGGNDAGLIGRAIRVLEKAKAH